MCEITTQNGRIHLKAPYQAGFNHAAKNLGGKWAPATKTWHFDPKDQEGVEKLAAEWYAWTPEATPTVTIRFSASSWEKRQEIDLLGRPIARRWYRDADVKLGAGVILISGYFGGSGGSNASPRLGENTAVLEVRGVPKTSWSFGKRSLVIPKAGGIRLRWRSKLFPRPPRIGRLWRRRRLGCLLGLRRLRAACLIGGFDGLR